MNKLFPKYFLTFLLLSCCVGYHIINWFGGSYWVPRKQWVWAQFEMRTESKVWFSARILGQNPSHYYDTASEWIGGVGYVFKYLFHQLPPMVVAGKSQPIQQFFHRENIFFQYPESQWWMEQGLFANLTRITSHTKQEGIRTIVLPIPSKVAIERHLLPKILPPDNVWGDGRATESIRVGLEDSYGVYRTLLEKFPEQAVDLYQDFLRFRESDLSFLYLPFEMHWTSLGSAVAATGIIRKLIKDGWQLKDPVIRFVRNRSQIDRWRFILLPQFYLDWSPQFNWKEPIYEVEPVTDLSNNGRLILAGTSFSRRTGLEGVGLGPILAKALKRELFDFSKSSGGLSGSFILMENDHFKFKKDDLFVLETPTFLIYKSTLKERLPRLPGLGSDSLRELSSSPQQ